MTKCFSPQATYQSALLGKRVCACTFEYADKTAGCCQDRKQHVQVRVEESYKSCHPTGGTNERDTANSSK